MNDYSEMVRLVKLGRRAEQRGKALAGCVGAFIISALTALLRGWLLMLTVGILHNNWSAKVPTMGYWTAAFVCWLLSGFLPSTSPKAKS